jgi:hypothetical protein
VSGLQRKLRGVALGGLLEPEFAELAVERRTADAQNTGGLRHAAARLPQGKRDELALDRRQRRNGPALVKESVRKHLPRLVRTSRDHGVVDMNRG